MNGMQVKYSELFRINIVQPFYVNQACKKYTIVPEPDFIMIPTPSCVATMERLDYLVRWNNEKTGLILLSRVSGVNAAGEKIVRFSPSIGDKLSFLIMLSNPSALNFNLLPVSQDSTKVFYFSNQVNDIAAPFSNLHLTFSNSGVDANQDLVNVSKSLYQFKHSATVAPGTAFIRHQLTGIERQATNILNELSSSQISFMMQDLPEGLYNLDINNIRTDTFYHIESELLPKVFGVVEVVLSHDISSNYRVMEQDKSIVNNRPVYTILFPNRPTIWRYTVELKENSPLFLEMEPMSPATKQNFINGLNIETNDTGITFLQTFASPDARRFKFESNAPVLFQEKYYSSSGATGESLRLAFKKFANLPGEVIVKNDLPYPPTGLIDASNTAKIYSDTLLTL